MALGGSSTRGHIVEWWDKIAGLGGTVTRERCYLCVANPSPGQHCPPGLTELGQPAGLFQRGMCWFWLG